mgnify:CR=1 FL=1
MDGSSPLRPQGNTFVIPVAPSLPNGATNVGVNPGAGEVDYLFYNPHGSVDAYIGYGMTSDAARANAVVPLIGASSAVVAVPHGLMKTYTLAPGLYFAGISLTGSCAVICTPGYGI